MLPYASFWQIFLNPLNWYIYMKILTGVQYSLSDGTFQRDEARPWDMSGIPPWDLRSRSFPDYGSVHTLLGNSISMCHYTADFWYICCPPASATIVLLWQSFLNAMLTELSPFSSSPDAFALFSWYPALFLSSSITHSLHNVQKKGRSWLFCCLVCKGINFHTMRQTAALLCILMAFEIVCVALSTASCLRRVLCSYGNADSLGNPKILRGLLAELGMGGHISHQDFFTSDSFHCIYSDVHVYFLLMSHLYLLSSL